VARLTMVGVSRRLHLGGLDLLIHRGRWQRAAPPMHISGRFTRLRAWTAFTPRVLLVNWHPRLFGRTRKRFAKHWCHCSASQ
jgi:hypothetical protein